jgi:hypothetical protein
MRRRSAAKIAPTATEATIAPMMPSSFLLEPPGVSVEDSGPEAEASLETL